jgi:hypothetical protein
LRPRLSYLILKCIRLSVFNCPTFPLPPLDLGKAEQHFGIGIGKARQQNLGLGKARQRYILVKAQARQI